MATRGQQHTVPRVLCRSWALTKLLGHSVTEQTLTEPIGTGGLWG